MPAYTAYFELMDSYNRKSSKEFKTVDTVVDFAAALALAAALASDIAGLSGLEVLAYTVKQRTVYTDTPDAGSNRDAGVTFSMRKTNNQNDVIKLPGPITSVIDPDGSIDLADAAVTAFIGNFLSGADWTFSDGEQATSVISGQLDK